MRVLCIGISTLWFLAAMYPSVAFSKSEYDVGPFSKKYWDNQFKQEDLNVIHGDHRRIEAVAKREIKLKRGDLQIVVCSGSTVRITGKEIYYIDTKSPGCKVGEYEAAAGTTISFWESQSNELRSIVIAKAVKVRGYTWPANSKLLFEKDENRKLRLYAVELGDDLAGTDYLKGQKVYVGRIIDDTGRRNDELSTHGEDPIL